jgi:hypothetical protein
VLSIDRVADCVDRFAARGSQGASLSIWYNIRLLQAATGLIRPEVLEQVEATDDWLGHGTAI